MKLVERFHEHLDAYKQQAYKETQVRREFIDPFFTALGWDVANKAGHAEAYKDVIHEDAIKVGGSTKAPDYCFRIGGVRKFFVEAKKPVVGVKDEPGPAYQLRRYAWSNKLPLSIVTDFEELAVYDCRIKPNPTDKPSTARVKYIVYEEYGERWDEIASIFAKDAILKGSFDKYAESTRRKRGTAEVDAEFLKEIEEWRELLARNIALRNRGLSVRELNFAVTRTIDRIIFLRMCEDRGVETYEQLRVLPNGPRIYPRLVELFYRADERYNSGLFHFQLEKGRAEEPDELTPDLVIDDRVLKDIIKRLYYPECPYEFSVLPAEILGHVYEQFLGKVIRLTKGHRAVVEDKPEVKKAGGVYYTPSYIVDYIVKHTVGKLLERKTPADVGPMLAQRKGTGARHPTRAQDQSRDRKGTDKTLRILDPACGSGSFLLGAYQYLLDWHLKWYTENDPEKWTRRKNPPIYQVGTSSQYRDSHGAVPQFGDAIDKPLPHGRGSDQRAPHQRGAAWRLTVAERKRILLNNIYGVDIDPQAVEVTKLSLLLKVLEGENQQTLENQLRLFHERALPDLGSNIKCGNSLIGPDFYDNQQLSLLDEEERYRINAFDWHAEFPDIMGPRGGDSGLGARDSGLGARDSAIPSTKPQTRDPNYGFDAVIGNPPYLNIRILTQVQVEGVKEYFGWRFKCAYRGYDLYVLFIEQSYCLLRSGGIFGMIVPNKLGTLDYAGRCRQLLLRSTTLHSVADVSKLRVFSGASVYPYVVVCQKLSPTPDHHIEVIAAESIQDLALPSRIERIRQSSLNCVSGFAIHGTLDVEERVPTVQLGEIAKLDSGTTGFVAQKMARELMERDSAREPFFDFIVSGNIDRYTMQLGSVRFMKRFFEHPVLPKRSALLTERKVTLFENAKIVIAGMTRRLEAAFDTGGLALGVQVFAASQAQAEYRYILAILNSKLLSHLFRIRFQAKHLAGGFLAINKGQLSVLPVRTIDSSNKSDKAKHDRMLVLVDRMLTLHNYLAASRTPVDKTAIGRQIEATDRQIDQLVYDLYGLTDDEIRIVEEAASS